MSGATLAWSAHPDPVEAVGELVGDLLAATAGGRPIGVLVIVVDPTLGGQAGLIIRTIEQLVGPRSVAGLVAPTVLPGSSSRVVPTVVGWATPVAATPGARGRGTIVQFRQNSDEPTGQDGAPSASQEPDVRVLVPIDAEDRSPTVWSAHGPTPDGCLTLTLSAAAVGMSDQGGGTRRRRRLHRVPCAPGDGCAPLIFSTATRRPARSDQGITVLVGSVTVAATSGSGHHHRPASVALFPEPPEESP